MTRAAHRLTGEPSCGGDLVRIAPVSGALVMQVFTPKRNRATSFTCPGRRVGRFLFAQHESESELVA